MCPGMVAVWSIAFSYVFDKRGWGEEPYENVRVQPRTFPLLLVMMETIIKKCLVWAILMAEFPFRDCSVGALLMHSIQTVPESRWLLAWAA